MTHKPGLRLALPLLLLFAGACAKKEQVVIFATARGRGHLIAGAPGSGRGGGLAVFKQVYAAEVLPKAAVDLGNWVPLSPEGFINRGRPTLACMSSVPYSAAAAGMEDISLSPKELERMAGLASFPLLASNLYLKSNKKPEFLSSQAVVQAGPHKLGFFSIILPDPAKPNRQKNYSNYKLEKETYEAERAIKALKTEGAKFMVMLLGVNPKTKAKPEYYKDFAAKVPRVDLIITDDPEVKKPFRAGRAWVARAGLDLDEAARISLELDQDSGKLSGLGWKTIPLDAGKYGEAQDILKIAASYRAVSSAHFGRKIGSLKTEIPLSGELSSPVADFAADCIRTWARANAAVVPASEPSGGFSSGPVTVADLYKTFPLDSSVVFVKIRGDDLENALAAIPPGEVSVSGLTLYMKEGGLDRVEGRSGPLVPGKIYHLAVPDSLVGSGEQTLLSTALEFANSKRFLREIVGWCFSSRRNLEPQKEPRIVYGTGRQ